MSFSRPLRPCTLGVGIGCMQQVLGWRCARKAAANLSRPAFGATRQAASVSLPIIDIAAYMDPLGRINRADRRRSAQDLDEACQATGFFYLVGHGVPEAEVRALHSAAQSFFTLPRGMKDAVAISEAPEGGRGYQRLGENVTQGKRDWHEALDFYAEPAEGSVDLSLLTRSPGQCQTDAIERMRPFVYGQNQWPSEPAGFREIAESHFARMATIGTALMEAMTDALQLPTGSLQPLTARSFWNARIIGYPPLPDPHLVAEIELGLSCGEHTDYGCWTILSQDETPGALEAQRADGSWAKVEPMPGAFVVNLGDMLSVWTGGRYAATPHQVRQTVQGRFRTSVAYFHEPNFDATISCLPVAAPPQQGYAHARQLRLQRLREAGTITPALRRALGSCESDNGALIYGEHLFEKVDSNFAFVAKSEA
mmetsp:Transcript_51811/g.93301  ORF Transcript_51811/g.93301 Transcript_51811/m.93301 type:complete len:424 (-) Transcript_51811:13-1284(-)